MSEEDITDIYNFRTVDEKLSTSGQPSETQLAALANDGFEVIINLALHDDPRYSLPDETSTVQSLDMEYVHIPVQFDTPAESDLHSFISAMNRHQGKKILIHCAANMRVSAFLGLYRVLDQHWSEEKAFELMHAIWEPNAVWKVFISNMLEKSRES